jgi:hypothetical protein
MRRIVVAALIASVVLALHSSSIRAQIPNPGMPSPINNGTPPWWPCFFCPQFPLNPPLPAFTSPPYVGPLGTCQSEIVTAAALYLCSELTGGPPTGGQPAPLVIVKSAGGGGGGGGGGSTCSVGTLCVFAGSGICWSGVDGGTVGGKSTGGPTGGFISGCGNASFSFGTLQPGDSIGGSIGNLTGGTLTIIANCGTNNVVSQTNTSPPGNPVGVLALCSVPQTSG